MPPHPEEDPYPKPETKSIWVRIFSSPGLDVVNCMIDINDLTSKDLDQISNYTSTDASVQSRMASKETMLHPVAFTSY